MPEYKDLYPLGHGQQTMSVDRQQAMVELELNSWDHARSHNTDPTQLSGRGRNPVGVIM